MKPPTTLTLTLLVLIPCLATSALAQSSSPAAEAPAAAPAPAREVSFRERYGVLIERNMFLRQRRVARPSVPSDAAPPVEPVPAAQQWALVGIVMDGDERRAYFESVAGGETRQLAVQDALAEGTVIDIEIDSITFQDAQGQRTIGIGQNLAGAAASVRSTPTGGAGNVSGASTSSNPSSSGEAGLSAEERMRRRRLQELNP